MRNLELHCLCALCGAYALQFCSHLPDRLLCIVLLPVSILLCIPRQTRLLATGLAGFLLLAFAAQAVIDDRLAPELAGRTLRIDVRVLDFPRQNGPGLTFPVAPVGREDLPRRIRLSWFDTPHRPAIGETWQLDVRLRRPRGFSNPGGLDYEAWLFRQKFGATGYVVNGSGNLRRDAVADGQISRLRRRFAGRIEALLPDDDAAAVLMAVAVGARHAITREQWDRYAATGTSHLMAISGLHIGLAAGAAYLISWCLLAPLSCRINIRDCAAVTAALAALAYAEVSGFAVPARRAVLMTSIVVLAGLMRQRIPAARLLAICCLSVLVTDPLAVLAPGFKLSFAAVGILLWHLQVTRIAATAAAERTGARLLHGLFRLCTTQWTLLFGLFPLTALLFGRVAVLAPLANLLALPVFNFVTVPSCLLSLALDVRSQAAGDLLLEIAHKSVHAVLWVVRHAAELPLGNMYIAAPTGLFAIVVLLPAIWSLLPPGWPGRGLAIVAALASMQYKSPAPPRECVDMHVLDVGQGLAVVMRTHGHTAVYDTGPSFRGGSDTGRLVLLPFLRSKGISTVDLLIVSHADQDHAGGVRSVTGGVGVGRMLVGEPIDDVGLPLTGCRAGDSWQWDGIRFSVLHPADPGSWHGNNASCVLEVRAGPHRMLLTGDIESPVERKLAAAGALQASDILLIPHHGSRTSSSSVFVDALRPRLAVVSSGFNNRWGFPKDEVVGRWRAAGAEVLNTASSGAISLRSCVGTVNRQLGEHRRDGRRYWHD